MANELVVKIEGLDALKQRFNRLPRQIQSDTLADAMRDVCKMVRDQMAMEAPHGETGHLAAHMTYRVRRSVREGIVGEIGPGKAEFYARFLEFGTIHMAPRPFMRLALEARSADAVRMIGQAINKTLKIISSAGPII